MSSTMFNSCLLIGWGMATAGGCLLNLGAGLVGGGVLLLGIVVFVVKIAGVYVPKARA